MVCTSLDATKHAWVHHSSFVTHKSCEEHCYNVRCLCVCRGVLVKVDLCVSVCAADEYFFVYFSTFSAVIR